MINYEEAKALAEEAKELLELQILAVKARHLLADLLLSDPTATIIFDFQGRFLYVNPHWKKVTGYTNDQLKGDLITSLVHPDDLDLTIEAIGYSSEGRKPRYFVNRYIFADGEYHWTIWHPQKPANDKEHGIAFMSVIDEIPVNIEAGFLKDDLRVKHSLSIEPKPDKR